MVNVYRKLRRVHYEDLRPDVGALAPYAWCGNPADERNLGTGTAELVTCLDCRMEMIRQGIAEPSHVQVVVAQDRPSRLRRKRAYLRWLRAALELVP